VPSTEILKIVEAYEKDKKWKDLTPIILSNYPTDNFVMERSYISLLYHFKTIFRENLV
jgi:hypothetical protein